jgi:hypothetical protein
MGVRFTLLMFCGIAVYLGCDAFSYNRPYPPSQTPLVGGFAPADLRAGDFFGTAVATDGQTLAVGAPGTDVMVGTSYLQEAGAVRLYTRSGNQWVQGAELTAAKPTAGDRFGSSVALAGGMLIVGAPGADNIIDSGGAVFVFQSVNGQFVPSM